MVEKLSKKGANQSISSSIVLPPLSFSSLVFAIEERTGIPTMKDFLLESGGEGRYSLVVVVVGIGTGIGSHPLMGIPLFHP